MRKHPGLGRADLLRLFASSMDGEEKEEKAGLCGYLPTESPTTESIQIKVSGVNGGTDDGGRSSIEKEKEERTVRVEDEKARFCLAASLEVEDREVVDQQHQMPESFEVLDPLAKEDFEWTGSGMAGQPLLHWSKLWPFLRHVLGKQRSSRIPDVDKIARDLAKGRPIHRLPFKVRKGWHDRAQLWLDRSPSLAAFLDDYDQVVRQLKKVRGAPGLTIDAIEYDAENRFRLRSLTRKDAQGHAKTRPLTMASEAVPTLVLGDLGQLRPHPIRHKSWLLLGRRLRRQGFTPWVLTPCPATRWSPALADLWRHAYWDRGQRLPTEDGGQRARPRPKEDVANQIKTQTSALLGLLGGCIRVERGLLRDLRTLLSVHEVDASAEVDLWNVPGTEGTILGFSLGPELAERAREQLALLPKDRLLAMMRIVRKHHAYTARAFGFIEMAIVKDYLTSEQWQWLVAEGLVSDREWEEAVQYFGRFVVTLLDAQKHGKAFRFRNKARWGDRSLAKLQHVKVRSAFTQALWAINRQVLQDLGEVVVPGYIDKANVDWLSALAVDESRIELGLIQKGFSAWGADARRPRFPLCWFQSRSDKLWSIARDALGAVLDRRELNYHTHHRLRSEVPEDVYQHSIASDRERFHLRSITRPTWADRMGYDRFGLYADLVVERVRFRLRWIPPGRFWMGDDAVGPRHEVTISTGFWMAETQTTQALWKVVAEKGRELDGRNPSRFKSDDRHPVEQVSWQDCLDFCARLESKIEDLDFTMPTEAQWEYACRAGTDTAFNNGANEDAAMETLGWCSEVLEEGSTHRVKRKNPNAWGLYDMHGNVWEWCLDGNREYLDRPVEDPLGSSEDHADRVIRGGSWLDFAEVCRSASRSAWKPDDCYFILGFRLVAGQRRAQRRGAVGLWAEGAKRPWPWDKASVHSPTTETPAWADHVEQDAYGILVTFAMDGVVFKFRRMNPGRFEMGSPTDESGRWDDEGPQHQVTLTKPFWMATHPVTQAQWQAVMGKDQNPSSFKGADLPVEQVSWHDCQQFMATLNGKMAMLKASLPTEVQWEYCCRGGATSAFNDGSPCSEPEGNDPALNELGWYEKNSDGQTQPVEQKRPNAWGLYDMHGNVDEWCFDGERTYAHEAVVDPLGPTESHATRVVRGGSWDYSAGGCRSADRYAWLPGFRSDNLGFRLVAGQEQVPGVKDEAGRRGAGRAQD